MIAFLALTSPGASGDAETTGELSGFEMAMAASWLLVALPWFGLSSLLSLYGLLNVFDRGLSRYERWRYGTIAGLTLPGLDWCFVAGFMS